MVAYSKVKSEYMERYHKIVLDSALTPLKYHNSNVTDANRNYSLDALVTEYKNYLNRVLTTLN